MCVEAEATFVKLFAITVPPLPGIESTRNGRIMGRL